MTQFIEIPANKQSVLGRKLIGGVGINDSPYNVTCKKNGKTITCHYYSVWKDMINRAYNKKLQDQQPAYKGCSVDKEWHVFSAFKEWMTTQDWKGKQLDKDILIAGNKEYGPNACIFVSRELNLLLTDKVNNRGKYSRGVSFDGRKGKYCAQCSVDGKQRHVGVFDTELQAKLGYLKFKSGVVIAAARSSEAKSNDRLKEALVKHSELLMSEYHSTLEEAKAQVERYQERVK